MRQDAYRQRSSGTLGRDGAEDESIRCALHYDADGAVDGYVAYKFSGWDTKPYTMEVIDLVAATESGYLELWQFLGSIDLIERVTWAEAPVDDPLTWALEDPRCIESCENARHALAPDPGHGQGPGRAALLRRRQPGAARHRHPGLRRPARSP